MLAQLYENKQTPSLLYFYSHGQLTHTCPALTIKTATIGLLVLKSWSRVGVIGVGLGVGDSCKQ